jgi:[acyl-carrier-protein] S-malonyltransferase
MMKTTAFLFPGQGFQSIGMGRELFDNFGLARQVFEEADDTLRFSISKLCFEGPEESLKLTENTQPAILTTSVACLRVLQNEKGFVPCLAAGHSLGEYSALVASGALGFSDAVRLVRLRGRFMQEAVPVGEGAMAAVLGLEREEIERLCEEASGEDVLSPANYNSPGQIVISGHTRAVERAVGIVKQKGKKALLLPVSAPFHSPLMKGAGERLAGELEPISVGDVTIPVVANVDAEINRSKERVKPLLVSQVSSPVLWEDSMRRMIREAIEQVIEVGPGKVLSGLMRRIDSRIETGNIEDLQSLKKIN